MWMQISSGLYSVLPSCLSLAVDAAVDSVVNIFDGSEGAFVRLRHAVFASRFCASIATISVSALGPIPNARSTMWASPQVSPVRLKRVACPLAYRPHDLETLDRRVGRLQRFKTSHRPNQLLELSVICLNDIVQVFDLPMHQFIRAFASAFNCAMAIV